jgi:putative SOS response-associated peptidase YedK
MCGRYVLYGPQSRLVERFELAACPDFAPRWNIPPQTEVLVLRQRPEVGRVGQLVKWGLNGFYEWKAITEGSRVRKQPYYIRPREDGEFFAMAGLLARWRTPDGQDLVTTCVITTAPNEVLAPIHDRMPVMLSPADFDAWLDPENHDTAALEALLKPAPPGDMKACAVGTAVSRAGNEGESCIAPLEPGDA